MQKAPHPAKRFLALKIAIYLKKIPKNMEFFAKKPYI